VKRREFIASLGSTAATWPLAAHAQQAAMPVIGLLSGQLPNRSAREVTAFHRGLSEMGFVEGRNVAIESRWADNHYDRLPILAADLAQRRVTLIAAIAHGGTPAALAAKAATTTIPIVFAVGIDPVKTGIVASLNRPGGNITGATFFANELTAKRLGLLHELLPEARVIATLLNPKFPDAPEQLSLVQEAARTLRLEARVFNASSESEIEAAFAALAGQQSDALFVGADPFLSSRHDLIIALAARHAVPAIYDLREATAAGGLISYASSSLEAQQQAGVYAGRILKGEKPADLPMLRPTKFELVINLKTATALGLTVPPMLLARAEEVIE
jgi:putative tryptophan/tyrosine transport system substrate-binding protein